MSQSDPIQATSNGGTEFQPWDPQPGEPGTSFAGDCTGCTATVTLT